MRTIRPTSWAWPSCWPPCGTKARSTRTSEQIAEQLANIGASLSLSADHDQTVARLYTLKRHLGPALDVFSDVLQHPTFPAEELDRAAQHGRWGGCCRSATSRRRWPAWPSRQSLYGYDHPYGRPSFGTASQPAGDPAGRSGASSTGPAWRRAAPRVVVVGDTTLAEIQPALEQALGGWRTPAAGRGARPRRPTTPPGAELVLVDKPGAVQSVLSAALLGFDRQSPDYFPLVVMNTALGGQFASRLNMNLREAKGYTYGARSSFDWRSRDTGLFAATTSVQTEVTAPALKELLKELAEIAGPRPVQGEELDFCKKYFTRGFPAAFETSSSLAAPAGDAGPVPPARRLLQRRGAADRGRQHGRDPCGWRRSTWTRTA